jgi:hypothetical protein
MITRTLRRRIQQIAIGILAMLSLSVSSVAACMCSHHEQSAPLETRSCHGPTKAHHKTNKTESKHSSFSENCTCVPPSTNLSVKSEGFKLKKHPAAIAETIPVPRVGFYSPAPDSGPTRTEAVSVRRSDRPPSSRGPPLS